MANPPGMFGVDPNPNYSYNQSFMPTVPMTSPMTGMTGVADAMINGYSQYLAAQNAKGQPTQLGSAAPSGLSGLISGLLGGSPVATPAAVPNDPTSSGLY